MIDKLQERQRLTHGYTWPTKLSNINIKATWSLSSYNRLIGFFNNFGFLLFLVSDPHRHPTCGQQQLSMNS